MIHSTGSGKKLPILKRKSPYDIAANQFSKSLIALKSNKASPNISN
jgi:hypothetical protein